MYTRSHLPPFLLLLLPYIYRRTYRLLLLLMVKNSSKSFLDREGGFPRWREEEGSRDGDVRTFMLIPICHGLHHCSPRSVDSLLTKHTHTHEMHTHTRSTNDFKAGGLMLFSVSSGAAPAPRPETPPAVPLVASQVPLSLFVVRRRRREGI